MAYWIRVFFFLCVLVIMVYWLSGCATTRTPDPAPPPTAIEVSRPCKALEDVQAYPKVTPDDTLKVLGASCKKGDQGSCARAVYLLALDRENLKTWSQVAAVAIEGCKK